MSLEGAGYILLAVVALAGLMVFRPAFLQWAGGGGRVRISAFRLGDGIFATLLALFFIFLVHAAVQYPPAEDTRLTLPQIAQGALLYLFLAGSVILNLSLRGLPVAELFGLKEISVPEAIKRGAGYGWAAYPAVMGCYLITTHFLGEPKPQAMVQFFLDHSDMVSKGVVVLMAVVFAPFCEEIIFRGYLYGVLKRFGGIWCAVLVSAMLFSAIHIDFATLPALFVFGIFLALAYERFGSLKVPLFMHATFNATSLILSLMFPKL